MNRIELAATWHESHPSGLDGVEFRQTFDIQPAGVCVRYWLHLDDLPPGGIVILVNGRALDPVTGGGAFATDVTDEVWLEVNTLTLRLMPGVRPGRAWLQPVPCAE
jgi:hypothetical protein